MAVSLQCAVDGDLVVVILGVSHLKNIQMVSAGKCGTCNYMEVSRTRLCENVSSLRGKRCCGATTLKVYLL